NHTARGRRLPRMAAGLAMLAFAVTVGACGSSTASPSASAVATPVPTPDPHLKEPVTADQLYAILAAAKLGMVANNANLGHGDPDIVKHIHGTSSGSRLRLTQYRA